MTFAITDVRLVKGYYPEPLQALAHFNTEHESNKVSIFLVFIANINKEFHLIKL
jgi:hypothetical protein